MASRIRYQQLLKLTTQRQISTTHYTPHQQPSLLQPQNLRSPAAQTTLSLFTSQCPRQSFSTAQSRPHPNPPKPVVLPIQETAPSSSSFPEPTTQQPPQQKKPKSRTTIRRYIFIASFLLLGSIAGSSFRLIVSPPPPPTPHTPEDGYTIEVLHEQAAQLPVIQHLSSNPAFESWDAYSTLSDKHKSQHLMAGVMAGSRGVGGYQRVFYNASTGEVITVVFFGGATVGWPGVVHGGLIATVLDESCGRVAFKQWGGRAGVTAKLELRYFKTTMANGFYVIRARPRGEEELGDRERGKRHYKCFVDATVEDGYTGVVTVAAEGLFVGGVGRDGKGGDRDTAWGASGGDVHSRF